MINISPQEPAMNIKQVIIIIIVVLVWTKLKTIYE